VNEPKLNSVRSTEQAEPADQANLQGAALPLAAQEENGELVVAEAKTAAADQGPIFPKNFRLDKVRSKELRLWMTTTQKPTETKQLRENFHSSFEMDTFDLKVPTLALPWHGDSRK
jgi:hypothetical protein